MSAKRTRLQTLCTSELDTMCSLAARWISCGDDDSKKHRIGNYNVCMISEFKQLSHASWETCYAQLKDDFPAGTFFYDVDVLRNRVCVTCSKLSQQHKRFRCSNSKKNMELPSDYKEWFSKLCVPLDKTIALGHILLRMHTLRGTETPDDVSIVMEYDPHSCICSMIAHNYRYIHSTDISALIKECARRGLASVDMKIKNKTISLYVYIGHEKKE